MTGLVLLALLAGTDSEAAPRVTARPSKTEVTVGETFLVEVQAEGPAGTTWTFPAELTDDERIELRASPAEASPAEASPPPSPGRRTYRAAVFALKDVTVPPLAVRYRLPDGTEGEATSEAVPLRVVSLLPKNPDEQTLADIRGPLGLRIGVLFWVVVGAVGLVVVGLLVWLVRRRRPPAVQATAPAATPEQEALAGLDALLASGLLEKGAYRPFYIELTVVAKRYLERQLAAPVLEMTSTEMATFLRDHAHGRAFLSTLRDLSTAADQIKFARTEGHAEEAARHTRVVRELITGLGARLSVPPATPAVITEAEARP